MKKIVAEKITLVLPAYNEARTLEASVRLMKQAAEKLRRPFEIIIAEDGSTDGTFQLAKKLAGKNVRVLHSEKKLGRGAALSNAIRSAKSGIIVYMDADLASDLAGLKRLIQGVEKGAAISTGSRLAAGNRAKRSIVRGVFSRAYNFLVRLLFGSRVQDHQCGFKAFRKSQVLPLLDEVEDKHWFWDTELLLRAQAKGLAVDEFPIGWKEGKESKVRLAWDVAYLFGRLVSLRLKGIQPVPSRATEFKSKKEFEAWNERMFKKFDNERLYRHPNPLVAWVENERARKVVAAVSGAKRILDAGCGEGVILEKIGLERTVGMDISREALKRARKRMPNARLVFGDAQKMPFRESSFDAVVCSEVLEHVLKPAVVLREAARVAKPGGRVVVTIPEEGNINGIKSFFKRLGLFGILFPNVPERMDCEWHIHSFSLKMLEKIAPKSLEMEQIASIPPAYPARRVVVFRVRKAFK